MPINEKRESNPNLGALIEGLSDAGVKFILVGGLASVVQGAPVTTMDVDIVHYQSDENVSRLFNFLKSVDAIYRRPDDRVIQPRKGDLAGKGHVLLTTRLGPLDVLATIEKGKGYKELIEHTIEIEFRGNSVRVLRLKEMIVLKEGTKDPKDKQRLPILKEVLQQLEKK